MPSLHHLLPQLTVLENVLAVRHANRAPWRFVAEEENRAREIVEFVGLRDVASDNAASLPQGQRRLLEIAKVLALDPKLVLLDDHAPLRQEPDLFAVREPNPAALLATML